MISIVIPTYDRAATLGRAIDSVLAQTYTDWELVIVDDGSTDDTEAVLSRYTDPRITIVRHDRNRGVAAAQNSGFDALRGEWFTVLGSDDELVPEALETLIGACAETGALAVTCNCVDSRTGEFSGLGWDADGWMSLRDLTRVSGEHWGLTHRSLLGDMRFDERLPGYEGVLWTKVTHRAGRRYYLHRGLRIYHTEGDDRVTVRSGRMTLAEQVIVDLALGEDSEYLGLLGEINPGKRRYLLLRRVEARVLARSGVLRLPGVARLRPRRRHYVVAGAVVCAALVAAGALARSRRASAGDGRGV